jgi:hypothetical protein
MRWSALVFVCIGLGAVGLWRSPAARDGTAWAFGRAKAAAVQGAEKLFTPAPSPPDPVALNNAAAALLEQRQAALKNRDHVADELAKVPATEAVQCLNAIIGKAKRYFQTDAHMNAWLVEIDENTFVCLNALACMEKTSRDTVAKLRDLEAYNVVAQIELELSAGRETETQCVGRVVDDYRTRMAQSLAKQPAGSRGRLFYLVTEDQLDRKGTLPAGAIHAEPESPGANGSVTALPVLRWSSTLHANMRRHEGVFVVALPPESLPMPDNVPIWTLGVYVDPVISPDGDSPAPEQPHFAFNLDVGKGKIIEPLSEMSWPYSDLEVSRAQVTALQGEAAMHERREAAQSDELAVRNREIERARTENEVLTRYNERLASDNRAQDARPVLPDFFKELIRGVVGAFGHDVGTGLVALL